MIIRDSRMWLSRVDTAIYVYRQFEFPSVRAVYKLSITYSTRDYYDYTRTVQSIIPTDDSTRDSWY